MAGTMILVVDIGNTSISMGAFVEDRLETARLDTHPPKTTFGYKEIIRQFLLDKGVHETPEGAVISSVVPGHVEALKEAVRQIARREPLIIDHTTAKGISGIRAGLGADRIASAVAAVEMFDAPVAVVDFGTATTVGFVGRGRVFKGGAIMPGLRLMSRALAEGTAQLPEIDIAGVEDPFSSAASAIAVGIIVGTAGAVERIIQEFEIRGRERYRVVVTGGYRSAILPHLKRADFVEPDLVLKGLKYIYASAMEPMNARA